MPWTLAQAAQNERDPFRQGVLLQFWMESNLMAMVPFETVNRLSIEVRRVARLSLPQASWVRIDQAYTSAVVALDSLQEEVFKLGRDVDIPRDLANLEGQFENPVTLNVEANVKSIAYEYNDAFVNGPNVGGDGGTALDSAPTGIRTRVSQIDALTGLGDAVTPTEAGGTLFTAAASSANRQTVLDAIDTVIYFIDGHAPDWGICNDTLLLRLNSAFRREGTLFSQMRDQYERWVSSLRGIPLYDVGRKVGQSTRIIANTEQVDGGGSIDSTSMFFGKNGVGTHFFAFEKEPLSVRDLGEIDAGPTIRHRIDWLLGWANWHVRSLGQVSSIRV